MNRVRKFVIGGTAVALAGLIGGSVPLALAQGTGSPGQRPAMHGNRMMGGFGGAPLISIALKHKTELNLGTDQVANLEKIKSHYDSQVQPIHQQLSTIEKDIANLTQQSPADLIQIKAKIQEGEKYRSDLRYLRIEALENGKAVLTPQQQDQLKTLVQSQHQRFRKQPSQPS